MKKLKLKKKPVMIVSLLGIIILVVGIILFCINNFVINNSKIEIIDATFKCVNGGYLFYETDEYRYFFPCSNSERSMYVKFENGNKMLIIDALEMDVITIEDLIKADKDNIITIKEK